MIEVHKPEGAGWSPYEGEDPSLINKVEVVTICGSSRLYSKEMKDAASWMTQEGYVVLTPDQLYWKNPKTIIRSTAAMDPELTHRIHFKKILMSDFIYVINPEGVVDEETTKDIEFAEAHHVPVKYWCPGRVIQGE